MHRFRKPAILAALLATVAVAGGTTAFGMPALDASSGEPRAVNKIEAITIAGAIVVADINQVGRV